MPPPMLAEDITREKQQHPAEAFPINVGDRQGEVNMEEDIPMPTRSCGAGIKVQAQAQDGNPDCNGDDILYGMVDIPAWVYRPSLQQRNPWKLRPFVASSCHRGVAFHLKPGLPFNLMFPP